MYNSADPKISSPFVLFSGSRLRKLKFGIRKSYYGKYSTLDYITCIAPFSQFS